MNSMIASAKQTSETLSTLSYNESSLVARSRASSDSGSLLVSQHNAQEKEFVTPINIYREHRGRIEDDKKSRTELGTEILDEDLYSPVQQEVNNSTISSGLNTGIALPTTKTWGYDMFSTNNMFGINNVAFQ